MAEDKIMTDELPSADDVDSAPSDDDYGEEDTFMEDVVGTERNVTADGGVRKKIILKGQGYNTPENGDEVSVHYVGTLLDGTKFDSSRDRDQPFTFKLGAGQVIRGWDEGVATMKKGEKSLLTCLPDYAYGKSGSPPTIPPDATLQFEVELLSWKSKKDLTGDGGVVKTILAEGSGWQRPRPDDEVLVRYKVFVGEQEQPQIVTEEPGVEFTLKEGHLCQALEVALKDMKKGEKAQLIVSPAYGCHDQFAREDVPPEASLRLELELVSWKEVINVTDDGSVKKKTLQEGADYKKPNSGASVTVRYTGKLIDGTKFVERLEGDEHRFKTDEEEVIGGLDLAVQKMKKSEKALVTIAAEHAFGPVGSQQPLAAVPGGAAVVYEVELVEFENAKESWEMSTEEKVEHAGELKDAGNALFKAGKSEAALKKYKKAVSLVEYDSSFGDEQKAQSKALKKSCWLNQAAANLRLRNLRDAVSACNKVIEQDHGNVKALYRRAEAHIEGEDFIEGIADLRRALELEPDNREVALKLKKARQLEAAANRRQAKLYGNMFERMAKMEARERAASADEPAPAEPPPEDSAAPTTAGDEKPHAADAELVQTAE